jgi:molybdopterin/thiamine biosynthesis adenylyltransferase
MDEIENVGLTPEEEALLNQTLEEAHSDTENKETLPLNSPSLLIDDTTSRFSSATWFDKIKSKKVLLAGLGGIGSYVAFLLSRLKVYQLTVYDNDIVEETNLSGQLYGNNDIGLKKTAALSRFLNNYSNFFEGFYYPYNYSNTSVPSDIMICGFDNMESRKIFYNNWKRYSFNHSHPSECLFIDGRLAAEEFQVFCITGKDDYLMKKYEDNWLFSDAEAEETLCSYKQTSFCANMIGSVIVNLFTNFVANQCDPLIPRELPFYTYYSAERMLLKTE